MTVGEDTDENGFYSVPNLCDGATTVFAYKQGYRLAPTADRPCEEAHSECRFLTIDGDTRFDIQLARLN